MPCSAMRAGDVPKDDRDRAARRGQVLIWRQFQHRNPPTTSETSRVQIQLARRSGVDHRCFPYGVLTSSATDLLRQGRVINVSSRAAGKRCMGYQLPGSLNGTQRLIDLLLRCCSRPHAITLSRRSSGCNRCARGVDLDHPATVTSYHGHSDGVHGGAAPIGECPPLRPTCGTGVVMRTGMFGRPRGLSHDTDLEELHHLMSSSRTGLCAFG